MTPPTPANEQQRLRRLRALRLLDTGPDRILDGLTRIAAGITSQPTALISLVDEDRQFFKSADGLPQGGGTSRQHAFCAHTICGDDIMEVPDARQDPRFSGNPLVTGAPHVVFYAGMPLVMPEGEAIGTVCVFGPRPARLRASHRKLLRELAATIVRLLVQGEREREEATRQQDRLATIIEHLPCGVTVFDADLMHVVSNQHVRRLLELPESLFDQGRPSVQTLARHLAERGEYGPGDTDALVEACVVRIRNHEQNQRESVRRNGSTLEIRGSYTPDGSVITTYTDVTATKEAERGLREALASADKANAAKSAFLATMSHELRTPLNGVIGLTQVLAAARLPVMEADAVAMIGSCAKSLLSLVDNILDLSKIEAGGLTLEEVPTDLRALVQEVSDVFSIRASEKGIRFRLAVDGDVPPSIACDPGRLKQILLNLMGNALKFTERGEFGLRVSLRSAGDGRELRFDIFDTGIGIGAADQRHLFTRYTQVDSSSTRRYQGTGLGLAISRQLARLMGGDVAVESAPGKGSTFTVNVPLKLASRPSGTAPTARPAQAAARVLVAEDNEINQIVARRLLALLGHEQVTIVENGEEAVRACREQDFDLILMDCQMPVMDGWVATRRIRAEGVRTPIAAMTASATAEEREKCLAAGMDDFISKPVELAVLSDKLARLMETGCARNRLESNPIPPDACQVFDADAMRRLFGDDSRSLGQAINIFKAGARRDIAALQASPAEDEAARLLHRLRGSAGAVGAQALARCCSELEEAPHQVGAHLGKVHEALQQFESLSAQLLTASQS